MNAIKIENLSKQYRLGVIGTGTLSHDLNRWWTMNVLRKDDPYLKIGETNDRSTKGNSDYVWALRDINMEIEQGDVVGIIGKNGAGKSTLLKILSRVTKPTTGTIKYRGRIASLLEVGTGFHAEMTGRENIYMNGSIMGMTRAEITRKLDEIVDFAGIERYLDTPVKRYSSGMTVRLGFSIAAHLEPEILVVDEELAVGDAEFQKKAIGKMQDVSRGEGRTVLFVSHNMAAVRNLCKTGYVLNNGQIAMNGAIADCIDYYINKQISSTTIYKSIHKSQNFPQNLLAGFVSVGFEEKNTFITNEPITCNIEIFANNNISSCRINIAIDAIDNSTVGIIVGNNTFDTKKNETKKIKLTITSQNLAIGKYYISISIGTGTPDSVSQCEFEVLSHILTFEIIPPAEHKNMRWESSWGHLAFPTSFTYEN